jgi:hypothetical protein
MLIAGAATLMASAAIPAGAFLIQAKPVADDPVMEAGRLAWERGDYATAVKNSGRSPKKAMPTRNIIWVRRIGWAAAFRPISASLRAGIRNPLLRGTIRPRRMSAS